jgi:hypothetical protein
MCRGGQSSRMEKGRRLLELALKGLIVERQRIDEELRDIRRQLGGRGQEDALEEAPGRRTRPRSLSAAYRKKISEGMKRRWAARRKVVNGG